MFSITQHRNTLGRMALLISIVFVMSGCAGCKSGKGKGPDEGAGPVAVQPPVEDASKNITPDSQEAIRDVAVPVPELKNIYFDYDKSELRKDQMATLNANAEWIIANKAAILQVEGHCDERGTPEYNLNLGQRRAQSVIEYLLKKGVSANRLHPISYGEDRPVAEGHNEAAWKQNRRVEFKRFVNAK